MALEELRQAAFAENAIGGQFVGKVGSFGHTVTRDWNKVAIAALEFRGRQVGALSSAPAPFWSWEEKTFWLPLTMVGG